ncbi:competence type IV pilus minor pilin ComGE [Anaerococcus marasmi]|uniref:competence type IV pilus minor pilin ComGE n=1 Tax=Anaerococcus marasmi TaxID=2057797 RepID=UPI000CFA067B|nr:competence type IV pilus minor pilin ComGE [Anaerococcus marasmi]
MKKIKTKGFTLIECIIALGFMAILSLILLPSLNNINRINQKSEDKIRMIYALEEAIEKNKNQDLGEYSYNINGFGVEVSIEEYSPGLKKITASCEGFGLELVR